MSAQQLPPPPPPPQQLPQHTQPKHININMIKTKKSANCSMLHSFIGVLNNFVTEFSSTLLSCTTGAFSFVDDKYFFVSTGRGDWGRRSWSYRRNCFGVSLPPLESWICWVGRGSTLSRTFCSLIAYEISSCWWEYTCLSRNLNELWSSCLRVDVVCSAVVVVVVKREVIVEELTMALERIPIKKMKIGSYLMFIHLLKRWGCEELAGAKLL